MSGPQHNSTEGGNMPNVKPKRYTMAEIKAANAAAGFNFFSRDTMRFFNSRIESTPYCGPAGVFFITSEPKGFSDVVIRGYTVREFHAESGNVTTLARFNHLDDARKAARDAAHDR